jgi:deazaflavin-dependent oxidoreductase (nitroreductase family)
MTAGWGQIGEYRDRCPRRWMSGWWPRQVPGRHLAGWKDTARERLEHQDHRGVPGEWGRRRRPVRRRPLLLLHTVGARSGQRRVNPMMYQKVDGGYAVFASKAGAPVNPDWYHNLLAHPQVTAEIGTDTVELVARVADGDERERIWAAQKAAYPGFADYERKTTRQIPVIVLEPARL